MTTSLDEATIEAFRVDFRGELIRPGDEAYDQARRVFNGMIDRRPALIARPTGAADVMAAVNLAPEHAGIGAGGTGGRIDPHALHVREVDYQGVVAGAVPGQAVAAAADRPRQCRRALGRVRP